MTTKNMLGGALINYGTTLPAVGTTPDGAVFLKTGGGSEGLYIYRTFSDINSGVFGNQSGAQWQLIVPSGGLDATTLDGFDSSYFQPTTANLNALSGLSGTGFIERTGTTTYAVRPIIPGSSKVTIGAGANLSIDVVPSQITITDLAGTLTIAKGGTGITVAPSAGAVLFSNGSAFAGTSVGSATSGSGTAQNWQVLASAGAGTPVWLNTNQINAAYAGTAGSASSATTASQANSLSVNSPTNTDYRTAGVAAVVGTIPVRDGSNDILTNSIKATIADVASISGGIVYRVNNAGDNQLKVCTDLSAIRTFLDVPTRGGSGATGSWAISISGSAASAGQLSSAQNFSITGPSGNPGYVTSDTTSFNGTAAATLRINAIDAAILGGTVANGRISGAYNGFTDITASGSLLLTSATAIVRRTTNSGSLELSGSSASASGGNIILYGPAASPANTGALRVGSTNVAEWTSGLFKVTGNIEATGNVTAYAPSDARLKKDVEVIGAAVDTVKKLRGVSYTMKSTGKREVGLIAQELAAVVPEVVRQGEDGFYGVQYGHLVGLLVEAIKEQQVQIEELTRRLDAKE